MRYLVLTIFVIVTLFIGAQASAISVGIGHGGIQFDFGRQPNYVYKQLPPAQECYYNSWGQLQCVQYQAPQQYIYVLPKKHHKHKNWNGHKNKGNVYIYKKGW